MDCEDLQEEELEVLTSIYDGDTNFKQISSSCFQYKIGDDDGPKSFLLEISWTKQYPNISPKINLDAFYNKKLIPEVKSTILEKMQKEAELQIGTPMTYTLIEWAKDNAEQLTELQPEKPLPLEDASPVELKVSQTEMMTSLKKEKKPKLSKQQKRKLAEKLDAKGERPRGWDWVDVVKHLSQIGSKQNDAAS